MRRPAGVLLVVAAALGASCGEPEPDLDVPAREDGQVVADLAGVVDHGAVEQAFTAVADDGWDAVALVFETPQANQGEAQRAGQELLDDWGADLAVVAVAQPGDFESDEDDRRRAVGVQAPSARAVPGDLREEIAADVMAPRAADNNWTEAFVEAATTLSDELEPDESS